MISGIILAAGTSSRLGQPKQLLELGGKILLQHVVDAAAGSALEEIIVVLGHEARVVGAALALPDRARVVVNDDYAAGQSTSLRAGIAACSSGSEAAVILLGDQPDMSPDLIDAIVGEWKATRHPVVRAMFGGSPGHPVLIAREQWALVDRTGGDAGLRSALTPSGAVHDVNFRDQAPVDIDTWEEYEALRSGRD